MKLPSYRSSCSSLPKIAGLALCFALVTPAVLNGKESSHASGSAEKITAPHAPPLSLAAELTSGISPTSASIIGLTNPLVNLQTFAGKTGTNITAEAKLEEEMRDRLLSARQLRIQGSFRQSETLFVGLLADPAPDGVKQDALLELAQLAQDEQKLPRAQEIYSQFIVKWPNAQQIPQILLRQGQIYRDMGLNSLALTKFYGVMTTALVVKNSSLEYYKRLVLLAQTEIAQTHFVVGNYLEAADFFSRLLKQNNPALARGPTQLRLIRCLSRLGVAQAGETISQSLDYLSHFTGSPDEPEVRFTVAAAMLQLGRNQDAFQQTLALLQEHQAMSVKEPAVWAYWQQRVGNEIGNQLYREGEYTKALDVYLALVRLNSKASWQIPVLYQVGLVYEKLAQPQKAVPTYRSILAREADIKESSSLALKEVLEMAHWRCGVLDWQTKVEQRSATTPAS